MHPKQFLQLLKLAVTKMGGIPYAEMLKLIYVFFMSPQIGTFLVLGFSIACLFALSILWRDHRKTVRLSFQVRGVRRSVWKSSLFIGVFCGNWQKLLRMVDVFHMVFVSKVCSKKTFVMTLHFLLGERKPRPEAE